MLKSRRQRLEQALAQAERLSATASFAPLPDDEHISWCALWAAEVYAPTHAQQLRRGLHELGWDTEGVGTRDAVAWLTDARAKGSFTWTRPGFFKPTYAVAFPTARPLADLPDTFAFMHPMLLQFGRGVSVLLATFALAETEQGTIDDVLREPNAPRVEPIGRGGIQTFFADQVKTERIAAVRAEIREQAANWIRKHVPGLFAAVGHEHPTWDLITSEKERIAGRNPARDWRQLLGLMPADLWSLNPASPDLTLAVPWGLSQSAAVPSLEGLRPTLVAGLGPGYDATLYSLIQSLEDEFAPTFGLWAVARAVEAHEEALAQVRDRLLPARASYKSARTQLASLGSSVLPAARDLVSLEAAAHQLDEPPNQAWLQMNAADPLSLDDPTVALLATLTERLKRDGSGARRRADEITRGHQAYAETLVAASNLRLQRSLLGLTALVVILTAIILLR
jgi:hypothetical protein